MDIPKEQTYRKNIDVQDDKVECKGEGHGGDEPHIRPRRHGDERLILRQTKRKYEYSHNHEDNIIVISLRNTLQMFSSPIHGV